MKKYLLLLMLLTNYCFTSQTEAIQLSNGIVIPPFTNPKTDIERKFNRTLEKTHDLTTNSNRHIWPDEQKLQESIFENFNEFANIYKNYIPRAREIQKRHKAPQKDQKTLERERDLKLAERLTNISKTLEEIEKFADPFKDAPPLGEIK